MRALKVMMRWVFLLLPVMLSGCITSPEVKSPSKQIQGEVLMQKVLPRSASIELRVLGIHDGKPQTVASTRYEVAMLPLDFDLRLAPLQIATDTLYLRIELRFTGNTTVQALYQQKVLFNGKKLRIFLEPMPCYPSCQ